MLLNNKNSTWRNKAFVCEGSGEESSFASSFIYNPPDEVQKECIKYRSRKEEIALLASYDSTCNHNVVSLLHRSDACSIYVASPAIQNNRILGQNCEKREDKEKEVLASV